MSLSSEGIRDIINAILSIQLGLELDEEPDSTPAVGDRKEMMTGTIQISGDWNGTVQVVADLSLIGQVASIMFSLDADNLARLDLRDALGELTNMAAGNIKALLPGQSRISLPTVVDGTDYDITVLDSETLLTETYTVADAELRVIVFKNNAG